MRNNTLDYRERERARMCIKKHGLVFSLSLTFSKQYARGQPFLQFHARQKYYLSPTPGKNDPRASTISIKESSPVPQLITQKPLSPMPGKPATNCSTGAENNTLRDVTSSGAKLGATKQQKLQLTSSSIHAWLWSQPKPRAVDPQRGKAEQPGSTSPL